MKIFSMIRAEFSRLWATSMSRLAFLALMCVPLLYGGLYLWANQDPYDKLDAIPVALVVADQGTTQNGKETNYGKDVADKLVEDGTFGWSQVSEAGAKAGVADGTFDFSVTLPADFSESLASSSTDNPHQGEVLLTTNDANSYLAGTIGEQAAKTIQKQIVETVNKQAARTFLDGLAEIRVSLVDATTGASKLFDGAGTLADGIGTAEKGSSDARDGAGTLADGLGTLATGAHTLSDGIGTLQQQTASLPSQTAQLADGAEQVAAGNEKIAGIGNQAGAAATALHGDLADARARIDQVLADSSLTPEQKQAVEAELNTLKGKVDGADSEIQGAVGQLNTLADGSRQVAGGARQLANATPQLTAGIDQLAGGAGSLASGADSAAEGATKLHTGLETLTEGMGKLGDGADTLHDGIGTLHDGLEKGVNSIPDADEKLRADQSSNIANPVKLTNTAVTSAGTYGAGLAPFFVSLAAWIGIYALFLILKPVSRRAITALHNPIKITLAGWATPAILGAIQMIALFGIVAGTLGFNVSNPIGAYGMMALASVTFAAIILALNVWLGSVGQFLGLILMVVQLVTAGGTFPWQTLPAPLAWLHHYLPMSYAVDGMRQLMYGGNLAAAGTDAIVLGCVTVGALIIAAIGVTRMTHFRTLRDLEPSLIG